MDDGRAGRYHPPARKKHRRNKYPSSEKAEADSFFHLTTTVPYAFNVLPGTAMGVLPLIIVRKK